MNFERPTRRFGWIAVLAISLLITSWHAKLGAYHPAQSPSHLISKAFKPAKSRIQSVNAGSRLVAILAEAIAPRDDRRAEPDFSGYAPAQPQPIFLSRSHWTRPPPARS